MSYEITSESYGRRLPKITATATSTDDLATLGTDWAEGSTCTISDTTYKLDKVKGWVDPSSGGGGGGASALIISIEQDGNTATLDKTAGEIIEAVPLAYVVEGTLNHPRYEWIYTYQYEDGEGYTISVGDDDYDAATLDDYPSYTSSSPEVG